MQIRRLHKKDKVTILVGRHTHKTGTVKSFGIIEPCNGEPIKYDASICRRKEADGVYVDIEEWEKGIYAGECCFYLPDEIEKVNKYDSKDA